MAAPETASNLLAATGLRLASAGRTLIEGLDLALAPGERLAVVGCNGSGKSTLLAALAGLTRPAAGRIVRPAGPPGMHFQDGALWPHLSVAAHLSFVDRHGDRAWRERLLAAFDLDALAQRKPAQLSGGERLRLGLARAFAARPRWVLLDEPLAHVDPEQALALRELLPAFVAELGATLVVVTHDGDDVLLLADRLLALTGDGGWWLGSARTGLEAPPTAALAALSGRGTVLRGVADARGRADLGLGLALEGQPAGAAVVAYLDATALGFASEGPGTVPATWLAPDRRGGAWVSVELRGAPSATRRLLRVAEARGSLRRGERVHLRVIGAPRLLKGPSSSQPADPSAGGPRPA